MTMTEKVPGNYHTHTLFILSGEAHKLQNKQLQTQKHRANMMYPIQSTRMYKLGTLKNKKPVPSSMPGTGDEDLLHQQLLKECQATSQLIQLSNQILHHQKRKESHRTSTPRPGPRSPRNPELSPMSLRRRYLPRRGNEKPPAAHQAAAGAAKQAQIQHPQAPHRAEMQTKNATTTNRHPRMTPFQKGFEMDTERELAQAFCRPPRMFKEDTPFYPWLPKLVPRVNFHLNFKF